MIDWGGQEGFSRRPLLAQGLGSLIVAASGKRPGVPARPVPSPGPQEQRFQGSRLGKHGRPGVSLHDGWALGASRCLTSWSPFLELQLPASGASLRGPASSGSRQVPGGLARWRLRSPDAGRNPHLARTPSGFPPASGAAVLTRGPPTPTFERPGMRLWAGVGGA